MRQVVLDTETTGLDPNKGHRIVEVGCIELIERRPTGRQWQRYLNPQRPMDPGAQEVTGLTNEFLADKALFADVAEELLAFIRGAELIIHNASFDIGFLDAEFSRTALGVPSLRELCPVVDSLQIARERFPGQRNSLDALCKRLQVDNTHRTLHGALLDAQLLTDVYLQLTSGQGDLVLDAPVHVAAAGHERRVEREVAGMTVNVRLATASELADHEARLRVLQQRGKCLWSTSMASTHDSRPVMA